MSKLNQEELLSWLDDFWGWAKTGFEKANMDNPLPENAEQAYQQIREMIQKKPPSQGVKEIMALNTVIKVINRMPEKDQQKFYKTIAKKVKKPGVTEEWIEKMVEESVYVLHQDKYTFFERKLKEAGVEIIKK